LQRGYHLSDRLLRPARVVVSKGSEQATESADDPQKDSEAAEE